MRFMNILSLALTIALLPISLAWGADSPTYKDGLLTIPRVDTADQVGKYQDATFKLTEQGVWQLISFNTIGTVTGTSGRALATIERVDVVKTGHFPVQVFLRASGLLGGSGCSSMGQISQRLENNRFEISITANTLVSTQVSCTANVVSFVKTIPVPVYGMSAGIYSYDVNGLKGTFELTADNKLPGDT